MQSNEEVEGKSVENETNPPKPKKRFKCMVPDCKAAYSKQCRLEVHIRSHTGERPFVCDRNGCSKSYTNAAHLKRHTSVAHESLLEMTCQEPGCGLVLSTKQNLRKHYLRAHDPTVAYSCAQCSLSFKKKYLLKNHLLEHFDKQPYKCEACGIVFSLLYQYNRHMKAHKTYSCDCGATFDRWSKFCEHRRTSCKLPRIDHKCAICDKIFTTSSNLKAHTITHLKDSQKVTYRCAYLNCTRSYQYKKNLAQHVRSYHEKDIERKKFSCNHPDCKQILSSKKNLKQHIRNMHSNLPKINKPRAKRKDKGIPRPKKNMVFLLSGLDSMVKKEETSIDGSIGARSTCSNSMDSSNGVLTSRKNNMEDIENSNKSIGSFEARLTCSNSMDSTNDLDGVLTSRENNMEDTENSNETTSIRSIVSRSTCSNSMDSSNDSNSILTFRENNMEGDTENSKKTTDIGKSDSECLAMDFSSIRSTGSNKDADLDMVENDQSVNVSQIISEPVNNPCMAIEST